MCVRVYGYVRGGGLTETEVETVIIYYVFTLSVASFQCRCVKEML